MKYKIKVNAFIAVLTFMFIICYITIPSNAKYVRELNAPFEDDLTLDYTMNNVLEVKSQDELFAAINNGYSYIQINKDVENPLIITQKAENLDSDLILDLNGIEIQRNGSDPILNINSGVRLTVMDTSAYADTYCYYQSSEDIASDAVAPAMADWHYTYFVNKDYDYIGTSIPQGANEDDYFLITIYGYEDTIKKATEIEESNNYYAAIQMQSGSLEVKSGGFYSYFGVDTTACVNAIGGSITVTEGEFSSRIPNATSDVISGVSTKENDGQAFGNSYFDNFIWRDNAYAKQGEGYCILTGAGSDSTSATINIGKGIMYSSNNSLISMQAGELNIESGELTKKVTVERYGKTQKDAALYINNGKLNISNAISNVYGDYALGVWMANGELDISSCNYSVFGSNAYGIYSTVSGQDKFTVSDTSFELSEGDNQVGIYTQNGTVNLFSNSSNDITVSGENSAGIYAENGSVISTNYNYTIEGANSSGVFAQGGSVTVTGGDVSLDGNDSYGVYAQGGSVTVTGGNISLGGANSYGVYSQGGAVAVESGNISLGGADSYGVYSQGGAVAVESGNISLDGNYSYGVFSKGGSVTVTGGNIELVSNESSYGVFVESNNEAIDVKLNGVEIDVGYDSNNVKNSGTVAASIGVYMYTQNSESKVALIDTDISCYELGIMLLGGQLNVSGDQNGQAISNSIKTKKASAIAVMGGNLSFDNTCDYNIESSNTTANSHQNAYTLTLPNGSIYQNTDGIYVSGGEFSSNGNISITHSGLQNATNDKFDYYRYTINNNLPVEDQRYTLEEEVSDVSFTSSSIANYSLENAVTEYKYNSLVVTSYAVRVVGGSVTIKKGNITATTGGGIYCSKQGDADSKITMGTQGMEISDITVTAIGEEMGSWYNGTGVDQGANWISRQSITGGHAIELIGGNIEIFGGKYEAYFGNGVAANGSGTIDIYDGEFLGWMGKTKNVISGKSGPAAFYGLKVIGGATVNLYRGYFNGGNGGAFISGIDSFTVDSHIGSFGYDDNKNIFFDIEGAYTIYDKDKYESIKDFEENGTKAQLYVYSGIFGSYELATSNGISDAFNIYDYSTVVFGAYASSSDTSVEEFKRAPSTWNDSDYRSAINMYGKWTSVAANSMTNSDNCILSDISIYYGTYNSNNIGMYNVNANINVYNLYETVNNVGYSSSTLNYSFDGGYNAYKNIPPIYYPAKYIPVD